MTANASLCLNMIVKNESSIVERLVDSVAAHVCHYVICDTGSTDDTIARIQARFSDYGVDGEIHSIQFLNFGQARNDALERGRSSSTRFDYFLLADADMELVVDDPAFAWNLSGPAYSVKQRYDSFVYYNTRVIRRDVDATYRGATHEYLDVAGVMRLSGVSFRDHACGANRVDKLTRDMELLLATLRDNPDDPRAMFYLAQTCRDAQHYREAAAWYELRCKSGGSAEEAWYARYQLALCHLKMGDWRRFVCECLTAYSERPSRAEPLHALSNYYESAGQLAPARLYTEAVESIPFPVNDSLFIESDVYNRVIKEDVSFELRRAKEDNRGSIVFSEPAAECVPKIPEPLAANVPIVRIWCGSGVRFCPEMIDQRNKPVAGSELAIMCMAREFARLGCAVIVYSGIDGVFDGVFYRKAHHFDPSLYSDLLISWRLPQLFGAGRPNARRTVLWAHDLCFSTRVAGFKRNEIPQAWVDSIDQVVVLSKFHDQFIKTVHPNLEAKTWISRNGLDPEEYLNRDVARVPFRYFYASDWVRGIEEILAIWPEIKTAIPEAELHVAYSLEIISLRYSKARLEEIYAALKAMPGVFLHDRLGHQELADLQLSCEAWLYPPQPNVSEGGFLETYCMTALEAQAAGCVPLSRLNGALPQTLQGRIAWESEFTAQDVIGILKVIHDEWSSKSMQEMLKNNRDWALSQSWKSLAKEWLQHFSLSSTCLD